MYWLEAIATVLCPYVLKNFAEKLNKSKLHDDDITLMEKFTGTTTYITPKNNHTWGYPVYFLGARLQSNIVGITKW